MTFEEVIASAEAQYQQQRASYVAILAAGFSLRDK